MVDKIELSVEEQLSFRQRIFDMSVELDMLSLQRRALFEDFHSNLAPVHAYLVPCSWLPPSTQCCSSPLEFVAFSTKALTKSPQDITVSPDPVS
jgi:hypothetical protein